MLKLKSKLILAAMLVTGVSTLILSCNKEETNVTRVKLQVFDFSKVGKILNAFLTNVKNNFDAVNGVNNVDEKIEIINEFNKKFASELDLPAKEKQLIIQGLEEHKSLLLTKHLTAISFRQNDLKSGNNDEEDIFALIETLATDNHINDNSLSILTRLCLDLKANYEGLLSDAQLKINTQDLITEFDNIGYQPDSGQGEMVATILAISIA